MHKAMMPAFMHLDHTKIAAMVWSHYHEDLDICNHKFRRAWKCCDIDLPESNCQKILLIFNHPFSPVLAFPKSH